MPPTTSRHLLHLTLSCRKISAHVTTPTTNSIIAMASSTEQEFIPHYKSKLTTFPRSHKLWDAKIATRVGEKLAARLNDVGVMDVEIDVEEEMARLECYRKRLRPFLRAVEEAGVRVIGSDKLEG
ncbi:hypothetical protein CTI12_AA282800 [Artemisia annua]|uniref:Uncharacterized protein n=1 Tax=Artemisia annua TaxID=35608 RepID=A0A2U1N328_ARTAN|nr:hypothetical protein CTI12_AA282800 [Artemisia annua]